MHRFGDVVVDGPAHLVLRAGEPQPVEPKAFAVLLALLQRPGELVGRDALIDAVWGHQFVTPGVLTRAIAQLRQALGDDAQHPRYIQTRHALGYCFVGELLPDTLEPPAGQAAAGAQTAVAPAPPVIHLAPGNEPTTAESGSADASPPATAAVQPPMGATPASATVADSAPPVPRDRRQARDRRHRPPSRALPWLVATGLLLLALLALQRL